jgi:5'-3' exonuclease
VREEMFHDVTPAEGIRTFFKQALTGDTTDNIFGIKGIGPKKAEMYLEEFDTEEELYQAVKEKYGEEAIGLYHKNLDLLWIWRELGITYTIRREINV